MSAPLDAAEAVPLVPPLAMREAVDRPNWVGEVRDPGLLNSIFPCLTGHLAQFAKRRSGSQIGGSAHIIYAVRTR